MSSKWDVAASPDSEVFSDRPQKPTVILADDHEMILGFAAGLLRSHFEVICMVKNGAAAVKAVQNHMPDLVMLDIGMPVLDGLQTAREIRKLGYLGKIAFLTVQDDPLLVNAAVEAGASAYILKKNMVSELLHAVERIMAGEKYFSSALKHEPFPR